MSCGLPIIGVKHGPIPEMVADGINGYLFQPFNVSDLKRKILQLSEDGSARRRQMSSMSLNIARQHSITVSAEKYIELYTKLI
jgi:glycosyltransferase involved in cell wall biosynthesis